MSADILGPYHAQHIAQVMNVSKKKIHLYTIQQILLLLHGSIMPQKVLMKYGSVSCGTQFQK